MAKAPRKPAVRNLHPDFTTAANHFKTEVIDRYDLTYVKAADILGVSRQTLHDLFVGKRRMTPELALRIEKAFDIPMEQFLDFQVKDDIAMIRAADLLYPLLINVQRYVPE